MKITKNYKNIAMTAVIAGALSVSSVAIAKDLRIVSWGGAYQNAQSIGIFQPAGKAMGMGRKSKNQTNNVDNNNGGDQDQFDEPTTTTGQQEEYKAPETTGQTVTKTPTKVVTPAPKQPTPSPTKVEAQPAKNKPLG